MKTLGKQNKTARGFANLEFPDYYENPCSVQASSIWLDDNKPGRSAIWLGVDDPAPKIMASKAAQHGVETKETTGWVPYPVPEDVLISTRMHLNRDQVKALIGHLQTWLKTGQFE